MVTVLHVHLRSLLLLTLIVSNAAEERLIFILAGQSNMSGRGGVFDNRWDGFVPRECQPNPSIMRLSAKLLWEEARERLHADIDFSGTTGVGPGMAFANAVLSAATVPKVLGLVPCAVGATSIDQWAPGTELYVSVVQRTRAAVAAAGGRVGALLWYQGEADTVCRDSALSYGSKMERLINSLRSDLGLPELPVIQVALASGLGNFTEIVRHAQKGIKLPNVLCVDAMGLELIGKYVHLTTQSQVKLGTMLATAFLNHTTISS